MRMRSNGEYYTASNAVSDSINTVRRLCLINMAVGVGLLGSNTLLSVKEQQQRESHVSNVLLSFEIIDPPKKWTTFDSGCLSGDCLDE